MAVQSRCATHPYIKVAGQWQYLYRAIDRDGNLVDVYLSETRDQEAAEVLFRSAVAVTGTTPDKVRLTSTPATRRPSTRSSVMTSNTALPST